MNSTVRQESKNISTYQTSQDVESVILPVPSHSSRVKIGTGVLVAAFVFLVLMLFSSPTSSRSDFTSLSAILSNQAVSLPSPSIPKLQRSSPSQPAQYNNENQAVGYANQQLNVGSSSSAQNVQPPSNGNQAAANSYQPSNTGHTSTVAAAKHPTKHRNSEFHLKASAGISSNSAEKTNAGIISSSAEKANAVVVSNSASVTAPAETISYSASIAAPPKPKTALHRNAVQGAPTSPVGFGGY